jgi:CP family cyanate transporter-like MFS transporter
MKRRAFQAPATGPLVEAGEPVPRWVASGWTIFWAASLGFFSCTSLVFALALPPLLAAPAEIPRLSAGMFTISYSCAMAIAVACGAAWDLTSDARFAFLPIALSAIPIIALAPTIPFDRQHRCF